MKKTLVKYLAATAVLILVAGLAGGCLSNVETIEYTVVKSDGAFEVRDYPSYIVAETLVDASLEDAGNKAFRTLFNYISGDNRSQTEIAMTAPVSQESISEKIAMTSPVEQTAVDGAWKVSFTMPAKYTMETLPIPNNKSVTISQVPVRRMVSVRYSGGWGEAKYTKNLKKLRDWMATAGLEPQGDPVWARYDPPFKPWFLRRNEILIPVSQK